MVYGSKRKAQSVKRKIKPKSFPVFAGSRLKLITKREKFLFLCFIFTLYTLYFTLSPCLSDDIKLPNVAGQFYPDDPAELSGLIDTFLQHADPKAPQGEIFALIVPHAGYVFSGQIAAFAYKLIQAKPYKTVIVLGSSHRFGFQGISVYPQGAFRTPLGDIAVDKVFAEKILNKDAGVFFEARAFQDEHSVEVQLPFLQRSLTGFKIVPVVMGQCSLQACQKFARLLKAAIGERKDVLVVTSSDMYHGYDYEQAELVDKQTIAFLKAMDAPALFSGLQEEKLQLCGGLGVVGVMILAKELGHNQLDVLKYANSAQVTGKFNQGVWTVGYVSCVIDQVKGVSPMLSKEQRKRLLELARNSIETYLKTNKKLDVSESDPVLSKDMGAFVTLREHGELRGCIGNLVAQGPLYQSVRDMAVEAAVGDSRFQPVELRELKDIEIEISALSPMQRVDSADKIELGKHGVIIKQGFNSGVFLPQVATETGWTKEEFLNNLCAHKAGISPGAWKDKSTEIYIFTAEVFSEKNY
ncbi:MAG: AmmeMemoRadiSam system protein B [Candidatus Omnitrophota bacterium]